MTKDEFLKEVEHRAGSLMFSAAIQGKEPNVHNKARSLQAKESFVTFLSEQFDTQAARIHFLESQLVFRAALTAETNSGGTSHDR